MHPIFVKKLLIFHLFCPALLLNQAGQEDWAQGRLQVLQVPLQEVQQVQVEDRQEQEQVELVVQAQAQVEPRQLLPQSPDQVLDLRHTAHLTLEESNLGFQQPFSLF